MLVLGVARWRAYLAYAAVRTCGWKFYRAAPEPGLEDRPAGKLDVDLLLD